ncbi:hypothetical protein Ddye_002688 [Dipteronia dyeriana]|uniref:RNase H type-1 domain-containing protein n=1 Tax=Dipteronia dyeriana TaxID=168575 RepID=A0AAD9XQV3_9ROSI|nr:hypothetical protein Ddye_002688 [Dipteronia dyeriana]
MLFFTVVWMTWEFQNQVIFKGKIISVEQAEDEVKFRVVWWFKHHAKGFNDSIRDLLLNLNELCINVKATKLRGSIEWSPLAGNNLKFNVDGSSLGKLGSTGIGRVLRDHNAKVLCSFSQIIGIQDSNTAEIKAFRKRVISVCLCLLFLGVILKCSTDSNHMADGLAKLG